MKEGIHPKYEKTIMKCACGATYTVGSTTKNVHVGICAACHPFFTGKQKMLDAEGRVEKFKKRYSDAPVVPPKPPAKPKAPAKPKPAARAKKEPAKPAAQPQA